MQGTTNCTCNLTNNILVSYILVLLKSVGAATIAELRLLGWDDSPISCVHCPPAEHYSNQPASLWHVEESSVWTLLSLLRKKASIWL